MKKTAKKETNEPTQVAQHEVVGGEAADIQQVLAQVGASESTDRAVAGQPIISTGPPPPVPSPVQGRPSNTHPYGGQYLTGADLAQYAAPTVSRTPDESINYAIELLTVRVVKSVVSPQSMEAGERHGIERDVQKLLALAMVSRLSAG